MKGRNHLKALFRLTIVVLLLFVSTIRAQGSPKTVVIVNPQNPISEITAQELRKIYYGKKTIWGGGESIVAVDLKKERKERQEFSQIVFQADPETVERNYIKMALSGTGHPPQILSTSQQVLAFVVSNPNAIGYVDEIDIDKTASRVKVILIRE